MQNIDGTLVWGVPDDGAQAYKRIEEVLSYHTNTVSILHTLKPIGVCMAARGTMDPFKD